MLMVTKQLSSQNVITSTSILLFSYNYETSNLLRLKYGFYFTKTELSWYGKLVAYKMGSYLKYYTSSVSCLIFIEHFLRHTDDLILKLYMRQYKTTKC